MQLADLGARVVKIENPIGGDPVRGTGPFDEGQSSPFARLNRNKESVALDLKDPRGKAAFLRLAEQADVVVENLRPGAMRKLGLGYDDVRAVNPRIVYASASGWGQDGPLAALPGLDIMAQARGGLMSITGTPDGEPAKIGVPICDLVCAMYVALGVTAALRVRDRDGAGQHVDVSLLESGVSFAVSGRPASTSPPARSGAHSDRHTRAARRTRRSAAATATSRSARSHPSRGRRSAGRSDWTSCSTTSGTSTRSAGTPTARSSSAPSRR